MVEIFTNKNKYTKEREILDSNFDNAFHYTSFSYVFNQLKNNFY